MVLLTENNLAHFQDGEGIGKELNEDESCNDRQATHHGFPKAKPLTHITCNHETRELADRRPIDETCLPRGGYLVRLAIASLAISSLEGGLRKEGSDESGIET